MNILVRATLGGIVSLMLLTASGCQQKSTEKVIDYTLKKLGVEDDTAVQYVVLPQQVRFEPGKGMGDMAPRDVAAGVVILIDSGVQEDWGNRFQLIHIKEGQRKINVLYRGSSLANFLFKDAEGNILDEWTFYRRKADAQQEKTEAQTK